MHGQQNIKKKKYTFYTKSHTNFHPDVFDYLLMLSSGISVLLQLQWDWTPWRWHR